MNIKPWLPSQDLLWVAWHEGVSSCFPACGWSPPPHPVAPCPSWSTRTRAGRGSGVLESSCSSGTALRGLTLFAPTDTWNWLSHEPFCPLAIENIFHTLKTTLSEHLSLISFRWDSAINYSLQPTLLTCSDVPLDLFIPPICGNSSWVRSSRLV